MNGLRNNIISLTYQYNRNDLKPSSNVFIFDRFGIIPCDYKPDGYLFKDFTPPQNTTKTLVEIAKERALSLGNIDLAYSGGIDGTFILAVYKSLDIPIRLVTVDRSFSAPEPLIKYLNSNCDVVVFKEGVTTWNTKIFTGSGSDVLFDSLARRNGGVTFSIEGGKLVRTIQDLPNPPYEQEIPWLNDYALKLGVKLKTQNDVLRLVMLCFKYYHYCYNMGVVKLFGTNQESFFDTQEFTDYAFTNCWDRQGLVIGAPNYKRIQLDFISSVFGTDFGVVKNE